MPFLSRLVKTRKAQGRAGAGPALQKKQAAPSFQRSPSPWTPPLPSPDPATGLEPSTFTLHQQLHHSSQHAPRYSTMIPQVEAQSFNGMGGERTKNHSSSSTQARLQEPQSHTNLGLAMVPQPPDNARADSPLSNLIKLCSTVLDMYQTSTTPLSDPPPSPTVQASPSESTSAFYPSPLGSTTQLPNGDSKCTHVTVEAVEAGSSLIRRRAMRGRPDVHRGRVQTRKRDSVLSTLEFFSQAFKLPHCDDHDPSSSLTVTSPADPL